MRWDLLFDDLGAQLDREEREEERALALEEERLRLSRLTLRDRLIALAEPGPDGRTQAVGLELVGGERRYLRPTAFGRDWLAGELADAARGGAEGIVPLAAIAAVLPMRDRLLPSLEPVAERATRLADRIGITFVFRDLSRRRIAVRVSTLDGDFPGTLDRVARDHVDLALHEPGVPRRDREVQGYRIVPIERIRLVAFG
ncbi:hypothetical protein ACDF64_11120 [Agromyces sp. MMS24-JH15]|uniref:hypothetical protein n=1 Tax=Agromyces sp. MMS24-JH15 TaxID=3243765 RepID=UPI00374874AC